MMPCFGQKYCVVAKITTLNAGKGECHECMNGKKILFQNILDNEDMTNKEKAKMIISKFNLGN